MNYFMGLAKQMAENSEDPNTHVGCALVEVDERNDFRVAIGLGWNHFPIKNKFPTAREGSVENTKYPYIIHAEQDALMSIYNNKTNKSFDTTEAYVTLFPCSNCAKLLVQAGIKKIFYSDDKYKGTPDNIAAKRLLSECGVIFEYMEK